MCGRYVVTSDTSALLADLVDEFEAPRPNSNVAPTTKVTVARTWQGERIAPSVQWGYLPIWAKDRKQRPQPINAKIETVATTNMFRKSFATARCIIPAAGYYEWVVADDGGKQPHFIHDPSAQLAMAGLVSAWPDPSKDEENTDKWVLSTAIITRDSHVAPGEVHDRMPACLSPAGYDDWLGDHLDTDQLLQLLDHESFAVAHELEHYEVTRDVNSVRNNGAHLIEPLPA